MGSKPLLESYPAEVVMTVVAMVGTAMLLPFALSKIPARGWEGLSLALPWAVWGALLLLGVGSGALANLWWRILAHTTASRAGRRSSC